MPGKGKYTNYSDQIADETHGGTSQKKIDFLSRLFSTGPSMKIADVIKRAQEIFNPPVQTGVDPLLYEGGKVNMDYRDAPDLSDVKFSKPGDPSTPYTPDIRAPGISSATRDTLGSTDTTDVVTNLEPREGDPGISTEELVPNYIPGSPGSGTKSPAIFSKKVADATVLGKDLPNAKGNDSTGGENFT